MEEATRESERRYRILFETAQEAILIMKGFIFVDCNPAAERLYGCGCQEIIGSTPFRFSPEFQPDGQPSQEKGTELVREVIQKGPHRFEWVHQALDGRRFEVEVSLSQFHVERPVSLVRHGKGYYQPKEGSGGIAGAFPDR